MTRSRLHDANPGNDNAVAEDDLQAYVDGQLDGRQRSAIESYLAAHPGEAARLAAYRAQNIGLHALFDPPPGTCRPVDRLPPRLAALAGMLDARLNETRPQAAAPRRLRSLAASVALLLAAGGAGWIALEQATSPQVTSPQVTSPGNSLVTFTRQAAQAPLLPAADTGNRAITPGGKRQVVAWLAAQPGNVPATLPDLNALGFRLTAEHVVPGAGGAPAAQLLYEDEAGERVTLTMRAGGKAGQASFTFARDGQASRFVWQDAHMAYSLVGSMAQEKLLKIAEAVSESLRQAPPAAAPQETAQVPAAAGNGPDDPAPAPPGPAPAAEPAPLLDKSPLIPVPLPEPDAPKDT